MASESRVRRKRHSAELKAQILAECAAPGDSVARVAMSHGINANVVHRRRQLARMTDSSSMHLPMATTRSTTDAAFVPVAVIEPTGAGARQDSCRLSHAA